MDSRDTDIDDCFAWRRAGAVLPLGTFDQPVCYRRYEFESEKLSAMMSKRMAGYSYKPSPQHIHNVILSGELHEEDKAYLRELLSQCGPWILKHFLFFSGATPRELAHAMIVSQVKHRRVTTWMNRYSSAFDGKDPFEKWADAGAPWS